MQIVKHDAIPEVVAVAAIPEKFDLIGLTVEQMAVLFILTGNCSGSASSNGIYGAVQEALNVNYTRAMPELDISIDIADIRTVLTERAKMAE